MLALSVSIVVTASFGDVANAKPKYQVLYTFNKDGSGLDGGQSVVGLTGDAKGNLYGITSNGGSGSGTIFEVSAGAFRLLYTINCVQGGSGCPDGAQAGGELVVDKEGNLYGTMQQGGANNGGTLFEFAADGHYNVLHNFCNSQGCTDGQTPYTQLTYIGANSGAVYDGKAPLYGATKYGGPYSLGLAYTFTPGRGEKSLYSFCKQENVGCKEGAHPYGAVSVDAAGTLYGTDAFAAKNDSGAIWSVHPAAQLHLFCDAACKRGSSPVGVFLDPSSPTLYGSTVNGGKPGEHGVAYAYDLSAQKYTVLHKFCSHFIDGQGCDDGDFGSSALYPDGSGGVIGTTTHGGITERTYGDGLLYRINLSTKKLTAVWRFCSKDPLHCSDGRNPVGQLVQYGGRIYGVTALGGAAANCNGFGCGVIYQVTQ
jgi:uncharacterized repeat protein (TIGR03803 family)